MGDEPRKLETQAIIPGVLTIDVPPEVWGQWTPQGKVKFVLDQLINFVCNPAFHSPEFTALRIQIRDPKLIIPSEVVAHIGRRDIYTNMQQAEKKI